MLRVCWIAFATVKINMPMKSPKKSAAKSIVKDNELKEVSAAGPAVAP